MSDTVFIMSVYIKDCPTFLCDSINSMLSQNYATDIFIYLDGPLLPNVYEIINDYQKLENVYVFSSVENQGLAKSLNFLIGEAIKAGYKYIARMDSDDICLSNRIAEQVKFLNEREDIDVCGSFCREFGATFAKKVKRLPLEHDELLNFSIYRCPFIHPTVVFRSAVFKRGNRYPENTNLTEDMALWFDLLYKGYRFGNINKVLLDYRLNEHTIARRKGLGKALSEFSIRFRYMIILKRVTIRNLLLVSSRLIFHFLPIRLIKVLYSKLR